MFNMLPTVVGKIVAKAKIQVLVYFRILLYFGQRVKQLFYVQEIILLQKHIIESAETESPDNKD